MSFGFGSGFGASSSPFGASSPSPFGQSAPAFGQNTSPFGATTSTGVFGQQPQQAQPAFGAAPAFGASAPAFGASAPAFGAASTPAFGSSSFGAKPAGGGFGFGAASSPSPFGAAPASTPAFGAAPASTPAFGAAPSPFGGASTGFGQSAPAFGAAPASTPAFGAAPAFGAPPAAGGFGAPAAGGFGAPAAGGFGAPAAAGGRGSRAAAWRKTQETDTSSTGTRSTVYYNSISCMPEYAGKSAEEIRWEDYQDGVKGGGGAASPGAPGAGGGMFGAPAAAPGAGASPFGAPAASPSPFGAASTPAFGAASTPAFGAGGFGAASTPAFGAASSPAFGGVSTPAFGFGSAPAAAPSPFGATGAAAPFGQAPAPAFGAASAPSFGATATPAFGAPSAAAPAFGGFGATSTPAFGAASAPAFGAAPAATPSFGGFGQTSAPAFGAASTPAFGAAPASTPTFSFAGGAASTPAFGATSAPAFGAASTGTSLFGAASTPAFGSTGGSLFGGAAQKPASTPGFSFGGAASTPAFGAASTPAFGASGGGGGLFGAPTPAFGAATGGGLFGAASTPAFSFSPAGAAPTPGSGLALGTFGAPAAAGAPAAPPGVASSPYGALPEAPKVTPLPEYRVGLTQRVLAPPSGGPPRHVALITPRSLTPHAGGKIRPRRGASASRMSHNPAEFLAAAAGAGGFGAGPSPVGSLTPGSLAGTPGSAANLFVPRDNPRKLFIRDTLPSTAAAGGMSVSPATGGATPGRALRTPGAGLRITPGTRGSLGGASPGAGGADGAAAAGPSPGAGGSARRGALDDDALAAVLPSLRRPDYYTEPSLTQLAAMARDDPDSLAGVANFTVGRRGVGGVRWLDPVDVRGIDLDATVFLSRGAVEVYVEEGAKPEVGAGLNRPAEVTMLKVFKVDRESGRPTQDPEAVERFARKLKKVAAEQGARFLSYDGAAGTWRFEVEHFSRYGLAGDDSDEEEEAGGAAQQQRRRRHAAADFRGGDDRAAEGAGRQADDGLASGSDADDEDAFFAGLGVRRAGATATAAAAPGAPRGQEAVVAEMDAEPEGAAAEGAAAAEAMEEAEAGAAFGGARRRSLPLSLPERMDMAPEELMRIRSGLYPGGAAAQQQFAKQRRIEVDLGPVAGAGEGLDLDLEMEGAGVGGQGAGLIESRPALAVRNAWRKAARSPLRPPAAAAGAAAAAAGAPKFAVPALPAAPMPSSPGAGALAAASPCPVKAPSAAAAGRERCLPDAGLALGASFRAGWAPGGVFCAQAGPGSAGRVALRRVLMGVGLVARPAAPGRVDALRRRAAALLRLLFDHAVAEDDTGGRGAPRWRLACSRRGDGLRHLTARLAGLCSEQAAEAAGDDASLEPTVLRHQAAAWELVHALFGWLPAEEAAAAAEEGDGDAMADGEGDGGASVAAAADTKHLKEMQRRAEVSRWLREQSRAPAERAAAAAAAAAGPGGDPAPGRVLALLCGHQLASAAAAAAVAGDVRLATVIAAAGGGTSAARAALAAQLGVWRDAGFDSHIDPVRRAVYELLAGDVDGVVSRLPLDWRRALGCHLWYGAPPSAELAEAVEAFEAAVEAGDAPPPVPLYVKERARRRQRQRQRGGDAMEEGDGGRGSAQSDDDVAAVGDASDVCFELLRLGVALHAAAPPGADAPAPSEDLGAALDACVAALLRPAGVGPDPLDLAFPWALLCVLRSIGALPDVAPAGCDAGGAAPARAAAGLLAQLLTLGALPQWAVFVALHLADASEREGVVREVLARTAREWGDDEEAVAFMVEELGVPAAWVAGARALLARANREPVAELEALVDAGELGVAHERLAGAVAPGWLLQAGGEGVRRLEGALAELAPRAAEIDAEAGAGAWHRGGGLYAAFLELRSVYAALAARAGAGALPSTAAAVAAALPGYEERMDACGELAGRLNDAAAALAVEGTGGAAAAGGAAPLRRAALAKMAGELAGWVMGDARGDGVPGASHAELVAALRPLRHGAAAAAVQAGAVALAEALA